MMVCVDSNSKTPMDTFCFSVVLVHKDQCKLGAAFAGGLKITTSTTCWMRAARALLGVLAAELGR